MLEEMFMRVTFELPKNVEQRLRQEFDDIHAATKEAALVELYRQGQLTQYELSQALKVTRPEVEAILQKHNVTEDLPTQQELAEDVSNLRRLLDK
jgi:hypothetical protein